MKKIIILFTIMFSLFAGAVMLYAPPSATDESTYRYDNPDKALRYFDWGVENFREENYRRAITHFQRAITHKYDFAEAMYMLGLSFQRSGRYSRAIRYYEMALAFEDQLAQAHRRIGESYLELGNEEMATARYDILKNLDGSEARKLQMKIEDHTGVN